MSCSYDNSLRVWEPDVDGDDWHGTGVLSAETCEGKAHTSTVWGVAFLHGGPPPRTAPLAHG